MGFRFRRSIKIIPCVRLNLSRCDVSTSLGPRGAHVTISHGQLRETVGLPGSGISYTETHRTSSTAQPDTSSGVGGVAVIIAAVAMVVVMATSGSFALGIFAAIAIYFLAQIVKGFRAGATEEVPIPPRNN